jgi:hypothetical protein
MLTPTRRATRSLGAVALCALPLLATLSHAADHVDSPANMMDQAADLTDVYAWHGDGKLVVVFGFAGFAEAGLPGTYDAGVLYTVHVDNDADNVADHEVYVRFGQNSAGDWGVQVENLPGSADPIVGPVDTTLEGALGLRVFAGPRDDPFFFDLDGFRETVDTGTLAFDSPRDSFSGYNVTAVVLEMSIDAVASGSDNVAIWATTGRM